MNKRGLTITEVLVTLALLVIVVAVVFVLFSFSYNSARESTNESLRLSQVKLASREIQMKLGIASEVALTDTVGTAAGYKYFYVSGGALYFREVNDYGTAADTKVTSELYGGISISFSKSGAADLLRLVIVTNGNTDNYDILIRNMLEDDSITGNDNSNVVVFR